jgi:hypothetical protein
VSEWRQDGPPPRLGVVQRELDRFARPRYLEIGVHRGEVFLALSAASKVGVDPANYIPRLRRLLSPRGKIVRATSDEFFARLAPGERFDVIFVDGDHGYEQAVRDIESSLRHLSDEGAVIVHDANPPSESAALPTAAEVLDRGEMLWCGEVWRAIVLLRATRGDLSVEVLDTDFGIAVIRPEPSRTLPLDADEVASLTYADLDADRSRLLGLRPPPAGG